MTDDKILSSTRSGQPSASWRRIANGSAAPLGADLPPRDVIPYSRRLPWTAGENAISRALRDRSEPYLD